MYKPFERFIPASKINKSIEQLHRDLRHLIRTSTQNEEKDLEFIRLALKARFSYCYTEKEEKNE